MTNKITVVNKVHISERGWWGSSRGFSHRRSVLSDSDALRNPQRQLASDRSPISDKTIFL